MIVYLLGMIDILAALLLLSQPSLSTFTWIVIIGLLYKFAISFFWPGIAIKFLGIADLLAAISLFTGYSFGSVGFIVIVVHFVKGVLSFMGLPLLRDSIFFATKRLFSKKSEYSRKTS